MRVRPWGVVGWGGCIDVLAGLEVKGMRGENEALGMDVESNRI